jgi:replicative DNA helicase
MSWILAAESGIPMHRTVRRLINRDWPRLVRTTDILASLPILVEVRTAGSDKQLLDFIGALEGEQGPGLVVIDGLELMTSAKKHPSRRAEAGTLIRLLRDVAGEKQIAIIASLTTRPQGEPRPDNMPVINDLSEWESMTADAANMVLFFHRPDAYLVYTQDKRVVEVIVANLPGAPKKNRGQSPVLRCFQLFLRSRCKACSVSGLTDKSVLHLTPASINASDETVQLTISHSGFISRRNRSQTFHFCLV